VFFFFSSLAEIVSKAGKTGGHIGKWTAKAEGTIGRKESTMTEKSKRKYSHREKYKYSHREKYKKYSQREKYNKYSHREKKKKVQ
jgi:hypothetical protein